MKALALVPALALAALVFAAPKPAAADDHHRGPRHYYSQGYRHYAPGYGYRSYGAAPYYRRNLYHRSYYYAPYYTPYYYGYAPSYYPGYYGGYYEPAPPVRYYRPRPRAHIGVFFGF